MAWPSSSEMQQLTRPLVPEWWYFILNVVAVGLGVAAVAGWPTYVSDSVLDFLENGFSI
jgi:hypothetical protein